MAWTNIPDDVLEPGKPIRSVDAIALRDNPIAIAQGLPGAPRVAAAALQTGNDERDWVLNRTAGAAVGAVGTYAFMVQASPTFITAGATLAGSSLRFAGTQISLNNINPLPASGSGSLSPVSYQGTPSGTWRCMGLANGSAVGAPTDIRYGLTLWLRIS